MNEAGKIHCDLVMGKSRVVPIIYISIQRLELAVAMLSVKIAGIIEKELAIKIVSKYI